jgi:hypothetical protein
VEIKEILNIKIVNKCSIIKKNEYHSNLNKNQISDANQSRALGGTNYLL